MFDGILIDDFTMAHYNTQSLTAYRLPEKYIIQKS